jgi:DNA-binding XRE family transcriptional regulator
MRVRPEYKAAVAERFKALRRRARITQAQLGDILGICRQSVNEIENSRVMPQYSTLDKFTQLEARHERERREPFASRTVLALNFLAATRKATFFLAS